jgi:arylsulfatase
MLVFNFLAEKYKAMMNPETNYGLEEAGMAQLDNNVGELMKALDDLGIADNTIVVFTTDKGAEVFTWPDGAMKRFRATKGTVYEGGFRVPAIIRWPGKVPAKSRTASSPGSTGSRLSWRRLETPTRSTS